MSFLTNVEEIDFDGMRAWRLTSPDKAQAVIAARGATLLSWRPREGEEIIDGYLSGEELAAHVDNRSAILAPWAGRIAGGQFSFGSHHVRVSSSQEAGLSSPLADIDFERVFAGDALLLQATLPARESYPWDLRVSVTYALESGVSGQQHLSTTISVQNICPQTAPVSIGWHPYIRIPGVEGISNLSLLVQARSKVATDANLIPLPGDAAHAGISCPVRFDYLGKEKIDSSFTDLVPDEDGVVVTSLTDPRTSRQVVVTQEPSEAPVVHIFTGDGLPRDERQSVAIEPYSAVPDAFNRADSAARIPLARDEIRSMTCTLTYRSM